MNPAGIHLVHKPAGPSSFSMVEQFRAPLPADGRKRPLRICHGGALDPFASGLLLILVEPATRLFDYLHDIRKTYHATIAWGTETDNGDPGGIVTFNGDASNLCVDTLEQALNEMVGWQEQVPPATSNQRVAGERAYLKAHRGEKFDLPAKRVYLHEARWTSHHLPIQSELTLVSAGGYYVRALARDLGRKLGCGAHLSELSRLSIGPWVDPGEGKTSWIEMHAALPWLPIRHLSDQEVGELRKGGQIAPAELKKADWQRPAGFESTDRLARGVHQDKLRFLLKQHPCGWENLASLA